MYEVLSSINGSSGVPGQIPTRYMDNRISVRYFSSGNEYRLTFFMDYTSDYSLLSACK